MSDVVADSRTDSPAPSSTGSRTEPRTGSGDAAAGRTGITLVVNPAKAGDDLDALTDELTRRCAEAGLPAPVVLTTSVEDPGLGQARQAVEDGAGLVLAAGGDGTVRAVAEALAGTGVPLGVVPLGTGNLLARNLGLPIARADAIETALLGRDRAIDVGRLDDGTVFAVMAGAGFDAAMMREAPEGLKAAVGWPAYIVGGVRSLRRDRVSLELRLDGRPPVHARVRTVLIGNMGKLQGGLELLPDAAPDDGVLDVVVVSPRRAADWVVLIWRGLTRSRRTDHRMRTYQAGHVDVRLRRRQPRQVDGDLIEPGLRLVATVEPGALVVRVPADEHDDRDDRDDRTGHERGAAR